MPPVLVVKKGSKSRSVVAGSRPVPESLSATSALPVSLVAGSSILGAGGRWTSLRRPRLSSRLIEPSGRTIRKLKAKSTRAATAFSRIWSKAGRSSGWTRAIASS
jgi:hypothetical protein